MRFGPSLNALFRLMASISGARPDAIGDGANKLESVKCAPPGVCETSVRELLTCLSVPGQVGFPPTMYTDAFLRLSRMGHQSTEVAFGSCEVGRFLPVRFVEPASRANLGTGT